MSYSIDCIGSCPLAIKYNDLERDEPILGSHPLGKSRTVCKYTAVLPVLSLSLVYPCFFISFLLTQTNLIEKPLDAPTVGLAFRVGNFVYVYKHRDMYEYRTFYAVIDRQLGKRVFTYKINGPLEIQEADNDHVGWAAEGILDHFLYCLHTFSILCLFFFRSVETLQRYYYEAVQTRW